jgi:hypothetical protein
MMILLTTSAAIIGMFAAKSAYQASGISSDDNLHVLKSDGSTRRSQKDTTPFILPFP